MAQRTNLEVVVLLETQEESGKQVDLDRDVIKDYVLQAITS